MCVTSYQIREYIAGEEAQIVELLQLIFDGWASLDYFQWKYIENPFNGSIIVVGVENEKIVGVMGTVFKNIKLGDQVFFSTYSSDGGVNPDYRNKGINKKMTELSWKLRAEKNYKLNYWMTINPILIKWAKKHQELFPFQLVRMNYILNIDNFEKKHNLTTINKLLINGLKIYRQLSELYPSKKSYENDLELYVITIFDEKINVFWDKLKNQYDFIIERKENYLNWNYCDARAGNFVCMVAENDDSVVGCVVLQILKDDEYLRGKIVDLLVLDQKLDVVISLIEYTMKLAKNIGITEIFTLVPENHPYQKMYRRCGFINGNDKSYIFYHSDQRNTKILINSLTVERVYIAPADFI